VPSNSGNFDGLRPPQIHFELETSTENTLRKKHTSKVSHDEEGDGDAFIAERDVS
jgi:hypothetical protein